MIPIKKHKKPIVWTISGSDSGGGAGVQADLHTFQDFAVHGCSVITALTAQNSFAVGYTIATERKSVVAQINALDSDMPANAIKIGMLLNAEITETVGKYLNDYKGFVVCDPVVASGTGGSLLDKSASDIFKQQILPRVDLLTPDFKEAEALTGVRIQAPQDMEAAAKACLAMGAKSVIITGGLFAENPKQRVDYWSDGEESFWLLGENIDTINDHGSGCTFSSAVTAAVVQGYSLSDALVVAKAYTTQGIRFAEQLGSGPGPVGHFGWPAAIDDFPELANSPFSASAVFPACDSSLGLCPVVHSLEALKSVLDAGLSSLRLQLNSTSKDSLREKINESVKLCASKNIRLFVDKHWELAVAANAYGVHLDPAELAIADMSAIRDAGLCLGVRVTSLTDIASAHALGVSYIEVGPIYGEQGLGLDQLEEWVDLLEEDYIIMASGGIKLTNASELMTTGVDGIVINEPLMAGSESNFLNELLGVIGE